MRGKRAAVAVVVVSALGVLAATRGVGEPDAPTLEYEASGCPAEPYEVGEGFWGALLGGASPHYVRDLAREGADHALLCQKTNFQGGLWTEALRITRGVKELQKVMEKLPRAEFGGGSTLVGYPPVNLVLHYPDGRRTVMSFEFNRGEVSSHRAIRSGAAHLTRDFARLWRAENTVSEPSAIAPADCLPRLPDPRKKTPAHPAPGIVHGFRFFEDGELRLPSALAVVRACRYTADGRGRLTLRSDGHTRTALEPLRNALNARKQPDAQLQCGGPGTTTLDSLHLTDVTGRTDHVYVSGEPCESGEPPEYSGSAPTAPEISAVLFEVLG